MGKKLTYNDVIGRFISTHGSRYDYSLVDYVDSRTKVTVVCKKHGSFEQYPFDHMRGCGCTACGYEKNSITTRRSMDEVISIFNEVHGSKYDYSIVEYKGSLVPVNIICKKHGIFKQDPKSHIRGHGCSKCMTESFSIRYSGNTDDFIMESNIIHGNKYDYSMVEYKNSHTPVKIICNTHGMFLQSPYSHKDGKGCPKCGLLNVGFTKTSFVNACSNGIGTIYLIKCFGHGEDFYKIGITSKNVYERYYKSHMPYDFDIIFQKEGDPRGVYCAEKQIIRHHSKSKYIPSVSFGGDTECFSTVDMNYIKNIAV